MTRDEVIRLAREAGMALGFTQGVAVMNHENLERFAALVSAHEREECARVCENLPDLAEEPEYQYDAGYEQGAKDCAAAIRARGNDEPS